jgi:hypothetical protein
MIAKHVKVFFKGQFSISGRGSFSFDHGMVVLPKDHDKVRENTVREINSKIAQLI